jgi:hypothetical protein
MTLTRSADGPAPRTAAETIEGDASHAAPAAGEALRGAEIALVVLLALLVCPPPAILTVVVVLPLLALALVAGVLAAVLPVPYLLAHSRR